MGDRRSSNRLRVKCLSLIGLPFVPAVRGADMKNTQLKGQTNLYVWRNRRNGHDSGNIIVSFSI